jgi:carbonic anhydrase
MRKGTLVVGAAALTLGALLLEKGRQPLLRRSVAEEPAASVASADAVLAALREGNRRFVSAHLQHRHEDVERRLALARAGQHPVAAVLACADSRCVPEIVFDQGLGDLFTIRVAGNVIDPAVLGSLEYAVEHLDVPLIVVLGHTDCGAVKAALSVRGKPAELVRLGPSLEFLVERIAPALSDAEASDVPGAVRANARLVANEIREHSAVLGERIQAGRLAVTASVYDVATGEVSILDR